MSDVFKVPETGIYKITSESSIIEATFEFLIHKIVYTREYVNLDRRWYQIWKPKHTIKEFYIYDRTESSSDDISISDDEIVVPKLINMKEVEHHE